ncbi:lipopolysaccharide biosynthesis protein [Halegenticoccus tardaugens]|uniref:lipopolysaccharide biosynthesis protein n=1 Tax=Halegenticoccus tardaugens TaxID=2071624 RepID=UPI00100A248A|nr:lipopolysaccharide biosynthesis protein [Halegenticoccus tardaugens]
MKDAPSLSVGREALLAAGSKFLMAAIGFGGVVIFANVLGDVGLGEYRTVIAAAFVLTQVPAGVATAVKKRVSEVSVAPPEFLGLGLVVHAAFTALVLVAFVAFEPFAVDYFDTAELAYGVVLVTATLGFFTVTNRLYSGIGYPALSSWVDAVRSVLTFLLQLLFLWLGLEAFGLVAGLAIATLVTAAFSWLAARVRPAVPTVETTTRVYEFARWSVPNALLTNLYLSADPLIVKSLAGAGAVGVYTVAYNLVIPAAMFAASIQDALAVKSSGVDSVGGAVREDLKNAVSYTGLLAIPIFFGALAIPNALMTTVFGASFADAPGLALVGLALYQVCNVYRLPFEAVLEGTNRPGIIFRVNAAVLVLYLPLAFGLGAPYGLLGVIAATIVAEAARVVAYQYVAHAAYGGVVVTKPVAEQVAAGLVMFCAVWSLATFAVPIAGWVELVAVVGVGAVAYFLALSAVSRHFRQTVRRTVPQLTLAEG